MFRRGRNREEASFRPRNNKDQAIAGHQCGNVKVELLSFYSDLVPLPMIPISLVMSIVSPKKLEGFSPGLGRKLLLLVGVRFRTNREAAVFQSIFARRLG